MALSQRLRNASSRSFSILTGISSEQIQLRFLRHADHLLTSPVFSRFLHVGRPIRFLQMREDVFRALENFLGNTRKSRHVDAVTLVRPTGNDLAQEYDLLVPFTDGDIEIRDSLALLG